MRGIMSFLNRLLLIFVFAFSITGVAAGQTSDNHTPLTNDEVIKLVRAGFKDKTVVSNIAARPAAYDLSADRMIELKRHGVSEKIIGAMLVRQQGCDVDEQQR